MRVRLSGEGEPSRAGGPPGDCYCFIKIRPHPLFRRDGSDLFVQLPISYTQAVLGARIEIPTLDGPDLLTVPGGTQSGEVFRLPGKGMPDPRGGHWGDLLVQTVRGRGKQSCEPASQELFGQVTRLFRAE
jgi:molecular chaperone DnaJ